MTQIAVLQTPEEIEHEQRRHQLYAALSNGISAVETMKKVSAAWPEKFYRASLNLIVDDLERCNRRMTRALNKCERRDYT